MRVSYRVAARGSSTRCELTLTRDRKTEPVRTTIVMRTMEGLPLPGRVLDTFFDSSDWLGPAAKVEGALTLRQGGAKDWEADFQGDLHDVDLAALVGRRFPNQRLSGLAQRGDQVRRAGPTARGRGPDGSRRGATSAPGRGRSAAPCCGAWSRR